MNIKSILLYTLTAFLSLGTTAFALEDEGFPVKYPAEIKKKNFSINLFYLDTFTSDFKANYHEFKAEVKADFLKENTGIISELNYQYLLGSNPSTMSGILAPVNNANIQDLGLLLGYKFGINENLGISPFIKARGILTNGKTADSLYGAELGADFKWSIYPETADLNLRYGLTIPFIHTYSGNPDNVSPSNFKLSSAELRLSYRVLENVNIYTGYQLRQLPKNLGNNNLATSDTLLLQSIMLGAGYVF